MVIPVICLAVKFILFAKYPVEKPYYTAVMSLIFFTGYWCTLTGNRLYGFTILSTDSALITL